ncbi:phosphoenolpyruvate carboxylase [Euzebya tangerina]|uniref:phosphoenolpyruvate carboxylase n=1 Tax=Euzebya tangerina TaxID=591198 RepID=UPI000E316E7A|nr:phosphoenolpyruvate carboxylase [Euzebya tangerina]
MSITLPTRLRDEIRMLGSLLGQVIREEAGLEVYELVEQLRQSAVQARRDGGPRDTVTHLVDTLDAATAEQMARAFTVFFQLTNIAEQRARVRALLTRDTGDAPLDDSVAAAIDRIADPAAVLAELAIHPVWTAHPTEARRRAVVDSLRRIDQQLTRSDFELRGAREDASIRRHLLEEISILWRTAQIRTRRPTPVDEVRKLMAVFDATVFRTVPHYYREIERALSGEDSGLATPQVPAVLSFGSWVGGDRDGNPRVTSRVTAETSSLMADRVLRGLENATRRISRTLSATEELTPASDALLERLSQLEQAYPICASAQAKRAARSPHRRLMAIAADRLAATRTGRGTDPAMAFASAEEFAGDIRLTQDSLVAGGAARLAYGELQHLSWQIDTFGFHLASLEIRQHTDIHAEALGRLGIDADDEDALRAIIESPPDLPPDLTWPSPPRPVSIASAPARDLSLDDVADADPAADVLMTMRTVMEIQERFGRRACHRWVISFTTGLIDLLRVKALTSIAGLDCQIIPLFETREDLDNAPATLDRWLVENPGMTEMEVMLGYSDSAKDAGFLAANLALYRAQRGMVEWAERNGITLTLFHGRGGALGRGGGPTNRAVLAQPPGAVAGRFKVTEQGEVINQRYGTERLAGRHLQQITHATMLASAARTDDSITTSDPFEDDAELLDLMATAAEAAWRDLVGAEGFPTFFRTVTPIDEIGALQMGSRPAKRKTSAGLDGLRAIPWTFAWAQSRVNAPGWYGLGTGLQAAVDAHGLDELKRLQQESRFFATLMENAELSLAKADPVAARQVLALGDRPELAQAMMEEYDRTLALVLAVTGHDELLGSRDVVAQATALRNPYLDVLTAIQIRWTSTARAEGATDADRQVLMLTMNGIAAALQNTG